MAWTAEHSLGRTLRKYQEDYARATALQIAVMNRDSQSLVQVEARNMVAAVCRSSVEGIAKSLDLFYQTLKSDVLSKQEEKVYRMAAEAGQKSMNEKYKQLRKKGGLSYRGGDPGNDKRYTGVLAGLLKSPDAFFNINGSVIDLVSIGKFYDSAPQWYRLNFGAGPISTPSIPKWNIPYFKKDIPGPDLSGFKPSTPFRVPAGVWSNEPAATSAAFFANGGKADGGMFFYPLRYQKMGKGLKSKTNSYARPGDRGSLNPVGQGPRPMPSMSKGIVGGRFLDHGINTFNRKLGWGMEALTTEWINHATDSSKRGATRGRMDSSSLSVLAAQANSVSQAAVSKSNDNAIKYKNAVVRAIALR